MTDRANQPDDSDAPFRESGSGDEYNPEGNWGAERRRDNPSGGTPLGPEGAPSGAGYGGFGPEGGYGEDPGAERAEPEQDEPISRRSPRRQSDAT
jgi:hypothetical protein